MYVHPDNFAYWEEAGNRLGFAFILQADPQYDPFTRLLSYIGKSITVCVIGEVVIIYMKKVS